MERKSENDGQFDGLKIDCGKAVGFGYELIYLYTFRKKSLCLLDYNKTLMIGSFKNPDDEKKQLNKYLERLRLKQKLVKTQEMINKDVYTSSGQPKPSPIQEQVYQNIQQELADNTLQLQKAQQNLLGLFKYPRDAKAALDLIIQDNYTPVVFNQVLPEFIPELKGVKDLTPSYFANQFERFMTIKKSREDNLVQIGVNDDKAKIENIQKVRNIIKNIKNTSIYGELSGGLKKQVEERLLKLTEPQVDESGVENYVNYENRINTLNEYNNLVKEIQTRVNSDEASTYVRNRLDEEIGKWLAKQNEGREEEGLPPITSVPLSQRISWVKQATKEFKDDLTDKAADYILERLAIIVSARRGQEVGRQLEQEFKGRQREIEAKRAEVAEKLKEMTEEEKDIRQQYEDEKQAYDEEKQAYQEAILRIKEENQKIREEQVKREKIRKNVQKFAADFKINIDNEGNIKIPSRREEETRNKVLKKILKDNNAKSYEDLPQEDQEEYQLVENGSRKEIENFLSTKLQNELKKENYFEVLPTPQKLPKKMRKFPTLTEFRKKATPRKKSREDIPYLSYAEEVKSSPLGSPLLEEKSSPLGSESSFFLTPPPSRRPAVVRMPSLVGRPGEQKQEREEKEMEFPTPEGGFGMKRTKTPKVPKVPKTTTNKKVKIVKIKK
jgi:hypothetical protein